MWCNNCQQDVPGVVSADADRSVCCARCNRIVSSVESSDDSAPDSNPEGESAKTVSGANSDDDRIDCPTMLDDWRLDEDMRAAERWIQKYSTHNDGRWESPHQSQLPHFSAHSKAPAEPARSNVEPTERPKRKRRIFSVLTSWLLLSLGMMAFFGGGVLLGWSMYTDRADLWRIGLPLALFGQAGLLLGLLLSLERMWQNNRESERSMDDLDQRVSDLKHATTMLETTNGGSANSFYSHLAHGANSQMLLADLKGQLDLLATKMANERR